MHIFACSGFCAHRADRTSLLRVRSKNDRRKRSEGIEFGTPGDQDVIFLGKSIPGPLQVATIFTASILHSAQARPRGPMWLFSGSTSAKWTVLYGVHTICTSLPCVCNNIVYIQSPYLHVTAFGQLSTSSHS